MAQSVVARAVVKPDTAYQIVQESGIRSSLFFELEQLTHTSPYQGLILALTFGERKGIDEQEWQALRNSGLIHLVAISGLHIGIAFSVGYFLGLGMMRLHAQLLWSPFVCGL